MVIERHKQSSKVCKWFYCNNNITTEITYQTPGVIYTGQNDEIHIYWKGLKYFKQF